MKVAVAGGKLLLTKYQTAAFRDILSVAQKNGRCCGIMMPSDYVSSSEFMTFLDDQLHDRKENWEFGCSRICIFRETVIIITNFVNFVRLA